MSGDLDFLHFDSIYGTTNPPNNEPYDTTFTLSNPIKNIKRIYLKSIELPIGFYNIRASNTTSTISLVIGGVVSSITLADAYYSSIGSLITALNSAFTALSLANNPVFSVNANRVSITLTTSASLSFVNTNLSRFVLGLQGIWASGTVFTGIYNYLLAYDNYIAVNFINIPTKSTSYNNQQITFKVPLNAVSNMVYFEADNQSFTQFIEILDIHYVMTNLRVAIYDRWGYRINSNGLDYTMSLAVSYH